MDFDAVRACSALLLLLLCIVLVVVLCWFSNWLGRGKWCFGNLYGLFSEVRAHDDGAICGEGYAGIVSQLVC